MNEDSLVRRRGQLEKSGRKGKATFASRRWSVLLEVWCIMFLMLFPGGTCQLLFGRSYGHFRRRRVGNWLENLAKHPAWRLVYYCYCFGEEIDWTESREIARGGDAQDNGGRGANPEYQNITRSNKA
jgi:hypothetical protein